MWRYPPPPTPLSPSSQPGPLSHSYQQRSELLQWKPVSLSLGPLGRKWPRSKPPSAVSSELGSLISLSGRESARDQVQSTRSYSKSHCVKKANKAPCVVFLRVVLNVGGCVFKRMQVRLKSQQEAALPRTGGERLGQAVLAKTETR